MARKLGSSFRGEIKPPDSAESFAQAIKSQGQSSLDKALRRMMRYPGKITAAELDVPRHKLVLELIRAGAKPLAIDHAGWNAFHHAARYGDSHLIEKLDLPRKALGARTDDGMTLLHVAVRNLPNAVECLLQKKGIMVNAVDLEGKTPLRHAMEYAAVDHRRAIVELLFRAGADPFLKDNYGVSPLEFAKGVASQEASGLGSMALNAARNLRLRMKFFVELFEGKRPSKKRIKK